MSTKHAEYPTIWFVKDKDGKRLGELVKHTEAEAIKTAKTLYGNKVYYVIDSGKKKLPNKCCDKCGSKPCGEKK